MQEAARKRNYKIYLQQIDDPTKTESYDSLAGQSLVSWHHIHIRFPIQLLDSNLIKHPVVNILPVQHI